MIITHLHDWHLAVAPCLYLRSCFGILRHVDNLVRNTLAIQSTQCH